jgi:tRNA threonylcarbamoyladenosine biosynthesis protein TsaB
MYLCIKSDSPEVYVAIWDENKELVAKSWQAGRELSDQILNVIKENCDKVAIKLEDLAGVIVYEGPGSYTGLRISVSVANAIGYSYRIPVFGVSGENWLKNVLENTSKIKDFKLASPVYGGEVYTTKPKK